MYYFKLVFKHLPALSSILSKNIYGAISIYVTLIRYLIQIKLLKSRQPLELILHFRDVDFRFRLTDGSPDVATLLETFVFEEYDIEGLGSPNTIVDVGAHNGSTAMYFNIMYPDAMIYAVEASPENYKHLVHNVKDVSNIIPVHAALCDKVGMVDFFETKSSIGSSLQKKNEFDNKISVPAMTFEHLYKTHSILKADLVKIDIEGAEEMLFTTEVPEVFGRRYAIEVHEDLITGDVDTFLDRFSAFELSKKSINQHQRYILLAEQQ